jgi:hypothetical protein
MGLQRGQPPVCRMPLPAVVPELGIRLTYRGVLQRIAEARPNGLDTLADLPPLTLPELSAVLAQYPQSLFDALADSEDISHQLTGALVRAGRPITQTYAIIGMTLVAAVRVYVMPIVLKDVQAFIERQREADSIEAGNDHGDTLTVDQFTGDELGVGRLFS